MNADLTTVEFHGTKLLAIRGETPATTLVAMKPVVEGMGLDWKGQYDKIKDHPVLAKGMGLIPIPSTGGIQQMAALPLDRLSFWLATIQPNRVPNTETRARVIRYQEECADVLFGHFFGRAAGVDPLRVIVEQTAATFSRTVVALTDRLDSLEHRWAQQELDLMAERKRADSRHAVKDRISVLELLEDAKAVQKGRRSINARLGHALRVAAAAAGIPHEKDAHSRVWLFPVGFAREFMARTGAAMVSAHNAAQNGQGVLPFPDGRRKPILASLPLEPTL